MTITVESRVIDIEVAHNIRRLGGYETVDGHLTSGQIVRSAGLHRLTPKGVGTLADLGIATVVDLRSEEERKREPTPDLAYAGIRSVAASVFAVDASPGGLAKDFHGYAPVYRSMLETGRAAYRTLFETIAETDGGVLFHCAAGKDRTGVASALLLKLAGVSDDVVVEDYALSESLLLPLFPAWLPRLRERGLTEAQGRSLLASTPDAMEATLAYIQGRWGSAEGYMREIGMTPAAIEVVRARMADDRQPETK